MTKEINTPLLLIGFTLLLLLILLYRLYLIRNKTISVDNVTFNEYFIKEGIPNRTIKEYEVKKEPK